MEMMQEVKKLVEFKHVQNQEEYFCSLIAPDIKYIEYDVFSKKVNLKKNDNLKFEKDQVCDKLIYKAMLCQHILWLKMRLKQFITIFKI